ncbi:T9SS type A sorting domain-containing protein [Chitinophaga horti]|uniref:T9SS type A sorting domain-containing protein n=1 Tax=Chitinophaga horti TaxID=2920382 RepID=A0ABY6IUU8_9BACT|nr:T9SS type A sorting domain-containing protein [Chitinophaga horti]UYQ90988.1 T9SS type A sorting domain-containing protein [Chitinophaga horti]
MKQFYVLMLLLWGMQPVFAQVRVSMLVPKPGQRVGNQLLIEGYAASSAGAIVSVKASVNTRTATMNITQLPYFFGQFNFDTLPPGPLQLHIIATDNQQHQKDTIINIVRDTPPVITVESPTADDIGRPLLRFKASAVDNGGQVAAMELNFASRQYRFTGNDIDTLIDVSAEAAPLRIIAYDTTGNTSSVDVDFYYNVDPVTQPVFTSPSGYKILDYANSKALTYNYQAGTFIYDLGTGQSTKVTDSIYLSPLHYTRRSAWITPLGAFFTGNYGLYYNVYEWTSGTVKLLQEQAWTANAAGHYIVWTSYIGDSLFLRNQATQTTVFIDKGVKHADVDSAGNVAYIIGPAIYRYSQGAKTVMLFEDKPNAYFTYVNVDGQYAAYNQVSPYGESGAGYYDGAVGKVYLQLRDDNLEDYDEGRIGLNNGHLMLAKHVSGYDSYTYVYRQLAGDSLKLLHTTHRFYKYGSSILANIQGINKRGDAIIYSNNFTTQPELLYFPANGDSARLLGRRQLDVYPEGDKWYASYQNELYRLMLDSLYEKDALPFTKPLLMNASAVFGVKDFTSHFEGPEYGSGQLMKIKITRLPTWGVLRNRSGAQVGITGQELTRADLEGLRYVPYQNVIGADTIRWAGSNGIEYGQQAAITLIVHPELDAQPKLAGLDSNYCSATASDRIAITNYPPVKWRTAVSVMVDGVPVSTDSIFFIEPAALAAGRHAVTVRFRHPLDSISTTAYFNVGGTCNLKLPGGLELLHAYPNPFTTQFTLQGLHPAKRYGLSLHDISGNAKFTAVANYQANIVLSPPTTLPKGIYYLKVYDFTLSKVTGVSVVIKQ